MNTGMQDAHNLAWRIALGHHTGRPCGSYLMEYGQERRPIAQQNAALSVRNFHRVLNVTIACYLNKQRPDLLLKALEQSSSLLPLSTRRGTHCQPWLTQPTLMHSLSSGTSEPCCTMVMVCLCSFRNWNPSVRRKTRSHTKSFRPLLVAGFSIMSSSWYQHPTNTETYDC